MKIESKYLVIPNVIMNDMQISNNSKILYALIRYWDYYQKFYITMEEIAEQLNVSSWNTIKKCLKELKDKNYIEIINKNKYRKVLKPLVSDELILINEKESKYYNRKCLEPNFEEINEKHTLLGELYEQIK